MKMNQTRNLFAVLMALVFTATLVAGPPVQIRQKDGTRWRGELEQVVQVTFLQQGIEVALTGRLTKVEDLYLVIQATEAGTVRPKTIFMADVVSVKNAGDVEVERVTDRPNPTGAPEKPQKQYSANKPGVFVLPLEGMVGLEFRVDEIEAIAKEADKYGQGQIIVLQIKSGGGMVTEMEKISKSLREIRKRHRVVAWLQEAISAACATAIHCDEIYFMTEGTAGSMTMFAGGVSVKDRELANWLEVAGDMMEQGGRSPYIAHAMIEDQHECSYDKDPVTGEVTFYPDTSGEFILSRKGENLTFNSTNAEHCGFSDGTADTTDELAELLDLTEWNEISDAGREMHRDWMDMVEKANEEIPKLLVRLQMARDVNTQIKIYKDLIRWWDRAPNVCMVMGVPPVEVLEQILRQLR